MCAHPNNGFLQENQTLYWVLVHVFYSAEVAVEKVFIDFITKFWLDFVFGNSY